DDVRKELAVKDVLIKKLEEELNSLVLALPRQDALEKQFYEKVQENTRICTELAAERRWTASYQ
ncbi:unnamed protein product, partial [Effrenium voratum]